MRLNNSSDDVKSWDEGYRHRMNSLHLVTREGQGENSGDEVQSMGASEKNISTQLDC